MEQFNLNEYLANPERKVVTRDGKPVRIICTDRRGFEDFPIIALVETDGKENGCSYTRDGRYVSNKVDDNLDLFFDPVKHEGWVNIHRSGGCTWVSDIYPTKIEAESAGCTCEDYVATAKIEWTE